MGEILIRIRMAPKVHPLRTDSPFKKIVVRLIAPNGNPHKIEVLGNGGQEVVTGIHVDTNRPYFWREGCSPVNTPREHLPLVTNLTLARFWMSVSRRLPRSAGGLVPPRLAMTPMMRWYFPLAAGRALKETEYKGSHSINQAVLDIPLVRLSDGEPVEEIVKECTEVVRLAWSELPHDNPEKETRDWNAQRLQILASVYGAFNLKLKRARASLTRSETGC